MQQIFYIDSYGTLNLDNRNINDENIDQVCALDTCSVKQAILRYLGLAYNNAGNKGCKYLSKVSFSYLRQLSLIGNNIGSAGIMHLSKTQWTRLYKVWLSSNELTTGATLRVIRADWKNLGHLHLDQNELTYPDILCLLLRHKTKTNTQYSVNQNKAEQIELEKMEGFMAKNIS